MSLTKIAPIALAAALAIAGSATSSSAAEKMSAGGCATADAQMMAHAMPKMPAATGNIDRDFAAAMKAQMQVTIAYAKLETECGKNEKAKAAAQTILDEEREHLITMNLTLHAN